MMSLEKRDPVTREHSSSELSSERNYGPDQTSTVGGRGKDNALIFLEQHSSEVAYANASPSDLKRLRRKVDIMLMPFLMLCYTLNFLDKVLLNYAAVMGLNQQLHLTGNQFSQASAAFWFAVLAAALVNPWPLQKVGTGKWLGASLICWGISTAAHAAVHNYTGLVVVRVFSGLFEAGLPPALMLLSAQYYTRKEASVRFSFWFAGMGLGQISGGLISFAFQHVSPNAALAGWRIMFIALGLFTVVFGAFCLWFVPDSPMQARFFNDQQKVLLLEHTKVNQVGVVNRKWRSKEILEALMDPQFWLMNAAITLQGTGGGTITAYSSQLLKSFGFGAKQSALLNMPSGVMNILSSMVAGLAPRYFGNRWLFSLVVMAIGVMGASLMSFLPITNRSGLLVGLYFANFFTGVTPLNFHWLTTNTAGHTKRALVTTSMNAAFAIGNIIGPYTFKAKDAPAYKPAKVSLVATWSSSAGCLVLLVLYYLYANKKRTEARSLDDEVDNKTAFAGMTDKENKHFRYAY